MKLLSVNVSLPQEIRVNGQTVRTGIFKRPVEGRVRLGKLNLEGDAQGDLSVHGGPDKAVYAYAFEHYAYWTEKLGRHDLAPGQFGENFTVEGMTEDEIFLGDVFRIGEALLEVSQPRLPCFKLGLKMGDSKFPKQFLASGRLGFYLRVLEEGAVGAGDEITRVRTDPEGLAIAEVARHLKARDREFLRMYYYEELPREEIARVLGVREERLRLIKSRALKRFREVYEKLKRN